MLCCAWCAVHGVLYMVYYALRGMLAGPFKHKRSKYKAYCMPILTIQLVLVASA